VTDTPKKPGLFGLFRRAADQFKPILPSPDQDTAQKRTGQETGQEASSQETGQEASQVTEQETDKATPPNPAPPAAEPTAEQKPQTPAPGNWFQRLKAGLTKSSSRLSQNISGIFTKRKLDADTLEQLEDTLIQADLGIETALRITDALSRGRFNKEISADEVRAVLAAEVERTLAPVAKPLSLNGGQRPHVILVVGVNGTGKTTTIGKLAGRLAQQGHTVTLAAGDTFRAAAIDQLKIWAERVGAPVVAHKVGADAAGLAFDALSKARENGSDVLLIDTAGRLQNKRALMDELEKMIRALRKIDPTSPHQVILVLDATTGQNALNQVEVFKDKAGVTGLVMTKLDGTARGGILVAISAKFALPVHAIGVGEAVDDLAPFDAAEFARAIALS